MCVYIIYIYIYIEREILIIVLVLRVRRSRRVVEVGHGPGLDHHLLINYNKFIIIINHICYTYVYILYQY